MKQLKNLLKQQKEELGSKKRNSGGQTWISRRDLETPVEDESEKRVAVAEAEKKRLKELATHYDNKKRRHSEEDYPPDETAAKRKFKMLPVSEMEARLRAYGQPRRLFGETAEECFSRLLDVEKNEDKAAIFRESHRHHSLAELEEDELLLDSPHALTHGIKDVTEIPKDMDDGSKIKAFISLCLRKWSQELESKDPQEKESLEGRRQLETYAQTKQHLKPLLKRLKSGRLEEEVTSKLAKIIDFCVEKEYVKAHDKYIELAIGNAAWPMGVTMVGIHERVGRSKIFSSEIAHILNDETTRKYIQMIKRLVTLCQGWNPTDPSKMVTITSNVNIEFLNPGNEP